MRFIIFFTTFLLLYGGMHLYAFLKARRALSPGVGASTVLIIFMVIMMFTPFLVRVLEREGFDLLPRVLGYAGYVWMGVLFLFFSAAVAVDIYRFLVYLGGIILHRDLSPIGLSARYAFFTAFALSVLISVWGYFEGLSIRTEHITVRTPKIAKEVGRLRIVQISDVHLGLIVREGRLRRILEKVRAAEPDILLSTGDLVDGQIDHMSDLAAMLGEVGARYGKFAVLGNHEFYAGLDRSLAFTREAGFTLLRGEGRTVSGLINIAGVDDPAGRGFGTAREIPEKALLSSLPAEKFTLFLKHRPLVDETAADLFDLQLSGHSHKGQIFPFTLIIKLLYPVDAGLLRLSGGSLLYVSRGTGTWGPPMRFLAPPEVSVIDLVPAS
jgi:predicted MPP superfamily phosphohydrolase